MKTSANKDDYKIVITKPSKYKRTDEWIETSGELSADEIQNILICDQLDTDNETGEVVDRNEYIFFTKEEEEFLSQKLEAGGEIVNLTEEDWKRFE